MNPEEMQLKSVKFLAIGFVVLMVFIAMYAQYKRINSLKNERDNLIKEGQQFKDALDYQNKAILDNMQDQNKTKELPTIKDRIKTRYVYTQNDIIQWRDKNETHDCNASIMFIDAFNYDFDGMH